MIHNFGLSFKVGLFYESKKCSSKVHKCCNGPKVVKKLLLLKYYKVNSKLIAEQVILD